MARADTPAAVPVVESKSDVANDLVTLLQMQSGACVRFFSSAYASLACLLVFFSCSLLGFFLAFEA